METATTAAAVVLVDLEDLHAADADLLLADALDHGLPPGADPVGIAADLAAALPPDAVRAHVLRPAAADLLA